MIECGFCGKEAVDLMVGCPDHGTINIVLIEDEDEEIKTARLNASFALDPIRWVDGYTNHTASALRARALAPTNGHVRT